MCPSSPSCFYLSFCAATATCLCIFISPLLLSPFAAKTERKAQSRRAVFYAQGTPFRYSNSQREHPPFFLSFPPFLFVIVVYEYLPLRGSRGEMSVSSSLALSLGHWDSPLSHPVIPPSVRIPQLWTRGPRPRLIAWIMSHLFNRINQRPRRQQQQQQRGVKEISAQ